MKSRYWLYEKDGAHGSLMAKNYDFDELIKGCPEYYEVSAFWYYINKLWRGLTPRAVNGLVARVKLWWLERILHHR